MGRPQVRIGSDIRVYDPPAALSRWCEKELTLPNPDYEKKLRMGYWTGNVPKTLCMYEIHGNTLCLPYGTLSQVLPFVQNTHDVISDFTVWPRIDFGGEDMDLYAYQENAVQALLKAKYGILQSPAGSGKTQMGIELIKRMRLPALWLTHTRDLLSQSRERALRFINPNLIGTITEGKVNIGKGLTFATVQTMSKLDLQSFRDEWAVVVTDECHHAAGTPTMVTRFSKVLNRLRAPYKFGLSATVHRADGLIRSVYALLGNIACQVPDEAVSEKIMRVNVVPVMTAAQLTEDCLKPDGTLDYAGLINSLCSDPDRNRIIRDTIWRNSDRPSLILSDRLEHLITLMNLLAPQLKEKACMVSGKTKKAEREAALEDMRTGRKQYLFATWALAKEGLDIPRLEALYMATPAKDEAVIIQAVGRVARTYPGKQEPLVFDLVDAIPYCLRAYKERCRHYRRLGARIE